MPAPALNLSISVLPADGKNQYQVIQFRGELDKAGLSSIRDKVDEIVEHFTGLHLVFDFSELEFINSEGIGYMTSIHSHLIKKDQNLVFVQARPNVKDIFSVIGIFSIINYFDTVDDFVHTLS